MLLLLTKKQRSTADYLLASWFLLILLAITTIYINYNGLTGPQWLVELTDISVYLYGPILWFYTKALTDSRFQFGKQDTLHLLPFVVSACYVLYHLFFGIAIDEKAREIILLSKMLLLPVYGIAVLGHLRQHTRNITNYYSFTEKIILRWLRFLVWSFLIIWTIAAVSQLLFAYGQLEIPQYGGQFTNLALGLFVLAIGYFGIRQTTIFFPAHLIEASGGTPMVLTRKEEGNDQQEKEEETGIDETEQLDRSQYLQLLQFMETEKPFLDGQLTIFKLATQIEMPPHRISKLINSYGKVNFFDFVNRYRIEEIKDKIHQKVHRQQTLLAIALDCGFNSKASFNRAFKKWTGKTPREYIQGENPLDFLNN
ncbi:MAG: AraC family transcriptional regulator [Saprospiraceae bacterium]